MYTYPYPWVNCLCILSLKTYLNSNYDDLAYEQKKRAIPGRIFLIAIYIPTVPPMGLARDRARAADRPAPRRHPRRRRRVREAGRRRAPFAAPAVEGRDRRVLFLGGFGARRFGARRFGGFLAPDFCGI